MLVVDDDAGARRLVRLGLELEGLTVRDADSVTAGRRALRPDLAGIVLDRELPDGDGLDLLADIGAICPEAVVVVNSTLDDGREPPWVVAVSKGDLTRIVAALGLTADSQPEAGLVVVDLVRAEAEALSEEWAELCRWDPLLPPDSAPPLGPTVVEAVADALQRPQPLGWGADPALTTVIERFAAAVGTVDVAIGQLVCLREAFRRRFSGQVPPAEEAESRDRLDMIIDRAIWSAARVAATHLERRSPIDPLTGLGSGLSFTADLDAELRRSGRYGRPASVVVLGVPALERDGLDDDADAVVRRVAGVVANNVRTHDGAYRLGPATFGLVLPETGDAGVAAVMERLRTGFGADVTMGSASRPADGEAPEVLVEQAQQRRGAPPRSP